MTQIKEGRDNIVLCQDSLSEKLGIISQMLNFAWAAQGVCGVLRVMRHPLSDERAMCCG